MNADLLLTRLRQFLLAVSAFLFAGSFAELLFIKHTKEPVQWIPFGLCLLGVAVIAWAWLRPQRTTMLALRGSMGVIVLGSLIGLTMHIQNNISFQLEVHPGSTLLQTILAGLGGASPLLAPGILAVAAVLALAATYYHPALSAGALELSTSERAS